MQSRSEPSGQRMRTATWACGRRDPDGPNRSPCVDADLDATSLPFSSTVAFSTPPGRVVVAKRHELDRRLAGLGRLDLRPAGIANAQSRLSGSVKRVHGAPPCGAGRPARFARRRTGLTSVGHQQDAGTVGDGIKAGHDLLLSTVRVAGQTPADADGTGTRLEPALKRAHDPRVDGGAFEIAATSICAFSPSGRRRVMRAEKESSAPAACTGSGCLLLLDVDELRIAAGEANLDAAGNRVGQRERRLADDVEQPQVKRDPSACVSRRPASAWPRRRQATRPRRGPPGSRGCGVPTAWPHYDITMMSCQVITTVVRPDVACDIESDVGRRRLVLGVLSRARTAGIVGGRSSRRREGVAMRMKVNNAPVAPLGVPPR